MPLIILILNFKKLIKNDIKIIQEIKYVYIIKMSSFSTKYRNEHPEYREKERVKYREIENDRYKNDEEFKLKKKERALAYYYKKKELNALQKVC